MRGKVFSALCILAAFALSGCVHDPYYDDHSYRTPPPKRKNGEVPPPVYRGRDGKLHETPPPVVRDRNGNLREVPPPIVRK